MTNPFHIFIITVHLYILYFIWNSTPSTDNTSFQQIWYLCYDSTFNKHYYSTLNNISNYICYNTTL